MGLEDDASELSEMAAHRVGAPRPHTRMYRHVHAHTGTRALIHVHTTYVCTRPQTYAYMHTVCVHVYTHLAMHTHMPQAMHVHELSTPIHRYAHTWAHTYMHIHPYLWRHTPYGKNR